MDTESQAYLVYNGEYICGAPGYSMRELLAIMGVSDPENARELTYEQFVGEQASSDRALSARLHDLDDHVETRLNRFARERGYDNIVSAVSYAADPDPVFAAEGQRAVEMRSALWQAWASLRRAMEEKDIPVPKSDELDTMLPPLTWE